MFSVLASSLAANASRRLSTWRLATASSGTLSSFSLLETPAAHQPSISSCLMSTTSTRGSSRGGRGGSMRGGRGRGGAGMGRGGHRRKDQAEDMLKGSSIVGLDTFRRGLEDDPYALEKLQNAAEPSSSSLGSIMREKNRRLNKNNESEDTQSLKPRRSRRDVEQQEESERYEEKSAAPSSSASAPGRAARNERADYALSVGYAASLSNASSSPASGSSPLSAFSSSSTSSFSSSVASRVIPNNVLELEEKGEDLSMDYATPEEYDRIVEKEMKDMEDEEGEGAVEEFREGEGEFADGDEVVLDLHDQEYEQLLVLMKNEDQAGIDAFLAQVRQSRQQTVEAGAPVSSGLEKKSSKSKKSKALAKRQGEDEDSDDEGEKEMLPHAPFFVEEFEGDLMSAKDVVELLRDENAADIVVMNTQNKCDWVDHMIFITGATPRHMRAIADRVVEELKSRKIANLRPSVEGRESDDWMIVDGGNFCLQIFSVEGRAYYDLERKWALSKQEGSEIDLSDVSASGGFDEDDDMSSKPKKKAGKGKPKKKKSN